MRVQGGVVCGAVFVDAGGDGLRETPADENGSGVGGARGAGDHVFVAGGVDEGVGGGEGFGEGFGEGEAWALGRYVPTEGDDDAEKSWEEVRGVAVRGEDEGGG